MNIQLSVISVHMYIDAQVLSNVPRNVFDANNFGLNRENRCAECSYIFQILPSENRAALSTCLVCCETRYWLSRG